MKKHLILLLLLLPLKTIASGPAVENTFSPSSNNSHPRLYITTEKIAYIKTRLNKPPYSKFWTVIKNKADEYSTETPPPTIRQIKDAPVREYGNRIPFMALAYLLTKEEKYLNATRRWMNALTSYDNWASNTDLGAAHLLFGMSIAYDWLYDKWTVKERSYFSKKISKHTNILHQALTQKNIWWTRPEYLMQNHNYTNVMSIAIAGIALQGETTNANKWLASARNNFQQVLQLLSPDGASHEGIGYWGYGMESLLKYYLANPKIKGENIIKNTPYFHNAARFRLYASLPGYKENVDFADSPRHDWYGPGYMLRALSSIFKDGNAQWLAERVEKARGINPTGSWLNLIWFDESVTPIPPDNLPPFAYFENMGIFISRSDWSDDASWVFFKAGPSQGRLAESKGIYTGSHIHPDAGNYLLWSKGKWLVIDDGYTYKKRTENHNVLLFDGIGQLGEGNRWFNLAPAKKRTATSKITYIDLQSEYQYLVAEIGKMYPPEAGVQSWLRSFIWLPPDILIINDNVRLIKKIKVTENIHFAEQPIALSPDIACLATGKNSWLLVESTPHQNSGIKIENYEIRKKETTSYTNRTGSLIAITLMKNKSKTLTFKINQQECALNKNDYKPSLSGQAFAIKSGDTQFNIDFESRKITFK